MSENIQTFQMDLDHFASEVLTLTDESTRAHVYDARLSQRLQMSEPTDFGFPELQVIGVDGWVAAR